ncbi:helicase HerA domain-containing protein [Caldivirga maquilingensis]|uniref:Helicase HerA central domain-containing protein n=1 Tax=Caldivirga maquilingensis (strain ATCC 700844 / DSM 13496 / JCM 10307 / IC-167) TaxID=397948 RepID=A8MCH9_CALMQ|nr:DUF87 domain-containing protein [Caldivirga maquilingensis]ABW01485.1 hypothetical protein Cmaq_0645 [Caldivirga maquilingensis IC-167]
MIFTTRIRMMIAALILVMLSSLITKYALIALVPLIIIFRNDAALLALSIRHSVAPQLVVRDNYIYDPINRLVHSFLLAEPIHDLLRLSEGKFINLVNEMLLRLNLCDKCYITFIVIGDRKVIRVSMVDEPPFNNFKSFQSNAVNVLEDYFMVKPIKGEELRNLVNQSPYPVSSLIMVLTIPLIILLLFGVLGIAPWLIFAIIVIKQYLSGRFTVNNGLLFSRISTRNELMMSKLTQADVYSLAKAFHNTINEYALVISGNSELSMLATREYHKASESLVVKERGKSYPGLLYWRNVIDRLSSGELPLRLMLLCNGGFEYVNATKSKVASYALWVPDGFLLNGLSHDAAVFIPFTGGRLRVSEDSRVIRIGVDSLGKPVEVDLDSLPAGHMLLLGPTGMGKSWAARTILARLIKMGLRIIVIDPHGEYSNLGLPIIDVSERFVDFLNPVGKIEGKETILRVAQSISEAFNISDLDLILSDLGGLSNHGDFKEVFSKAAETTYNIELSYVYSIIASSLGKRGLITPEELRQGVVLSFKSILPNPELTAFAMNQVTAYLYSMFAGKVSKLSNILAVDEAYYVMDSRLMELYVRGLRKSGLGVMLITQTLTNVSSSLIQNIPLIIMMGGPDSYIIESMNYLKLDQNEFEWLRLGLAPHMMGNRSRALLIEGPVRRQVLVDLDPRLKPMNN